MRLKETIAKGLFKYFIKFILDNLDSFSSNYTALSISFSIILIYAQKAREYNNAKNKLEKVICSI